MLNNYYIYNRMQITNEFIYIYLISTIIYGLSIGFCIKQIFKNFEMNNEIQSQSNCSKKDKNKTPLFGGLIFIIPILLYLGLIGNWGLLIFLLVGAIIGFIDDISKIIGRRTSRGIKKNTKILLYIINYLVYLIFLVPKGTIISSKNMIIYFALTSGILVTDGIDGLLGSLSIISFFAIFFLTTSLITKNLCILSIIAMLPFLYYNKNKASLFMGDTGSSFLAVFLYYLIANSSHKLELSSIYLIGFLTSSIQLITKKFNRNIIKIAPFHHNLEYYKWTENEIVIFYTFIYLGVLSLIKIF